MDQGDQENGEKISSDAFWRVISSDAMTKSIPLLQRVDKDDYTTQYLPLIESSITSILNGEKQSRVKFQDIYSCVYKGVMSCHSEDLLMLLVKMTKSHLHGVTLGLQNTPADNLLPAFLTTMQSYFASSDSLIAVFAYLDRAYVTVEKRSSLSNVLLHLFYDSVVKPCKVEEIVNATNNHPDMSEVISYTKQGLLKIETAIMPNQETAAETYKIIYGSHLSRKRISSSDNDRPCKQQTIR